jgi:dTDP-4-amino-4,6-dideoxygalactose transaminase
MSLTPIPFNRPAITGHEQTYILNAIANGHASGDGKFTKQCHTFLEQSLGVPKALLTTNCTHALEMTAILLNLQDGDEVILPSFTFVSTVNAYVLRGAKPVFLDVRPDTLNLDERLLEAAITQRTRAIVVVHYAGIACDMVAIMAIAQRHNIPVIEDNAHGLFAKYRGQWLGTFGVMATQSFHETKNFTCGEGGALILNDAQYIERAEIIREKGTNRSRFFRGQVDKYTWVDVGSSYLPSDILAAYLYAQFEQRDAIQTKRRHIYNTYAERLSAWAAANGVQLPHVPADCENPYHLFWMLLPNLAARTKFIAHLKQHQIQSVFHYLPLHLSDMGKSLGGQVGDCPVTERISDQLARLPLFYDMTDAQLAYIVDTITAYRVEA